MPVLRLILLSTLCLQCLSNTDADDKGKPRAGPATVENRVMESDLTTIKLTADAERRLGIEQVSAERKTVAQSRRLPGEVLIPPGRTIIISAPVAGLVTLPPASTSPLSGGRRVVRGNALLQLQPGESRDGRTFVPADRISLVRARADLTAARIEAEGQLEQARVRVEAAEQQPDGLGHAIRSAICQQLLDPLKAGGQRLILGSNAGDFGVLVGL